MAQLQWNQTRPDFGGANQSMALAMRGTAQAGDIAEGFLRRITEQDRETARQKERAEDVAFRQAQADAAKDQFNKQYALSGLRETRDAEEQAQKMATADAQAKASEYLNAARQNVVTPQQADRILAAYNRDPRADVMKMQAEAVKQYEASPVLQKQFLGNVNIDQGPMERTVKTIDPSTGQVIDKPLSVSPDMKEAQARKDMILAGLDKTISEDKRLQAEWDMLKAKEAGDDKRLGRQLAARAKEAKAERFQPYVVTVGFDKNGKPTDNPSQIAYKSQINVTRPDMEGAVLAKYGAKNVQLGAVTDFIPNNGKKVEKLSLYSASPEAVAMKDKVGGWDVDTVNRVGQRLQNTFKTTPAETTAILDQSIDASIFDNELKPGKLRDVLYNMGYIKSKTGSQADNVIKALTAED